MNITKWTTTKESYKKYALVNFLGNNIFSFFLLISIILTLVFAPTELTGTGYIAVISLCVVFSVIILMIVLSSLTEMYVKYNTFIEYNGTNFRYKYADRHFQAESIHTVERIDEILCTKGYICILGSITKRRFDNTSSLIDEDSTERLLIPRIFSNEEGLIQALNEFKGKSENA